MKATISAVGELRITPETEMESWALRAWFVAYHGNRDTARTTLIVEDIRIDARPMEMRNDDALTRYQGSD